MDDGRQRYPGGHRLHGVPGPVEARLRITARGLGVGLVAGAALAAVAAVVLMSVVAVVTPSPPLSGDDGLADLRLLVVLVATVAGAGLGLTAQVLVAALLGLVRRTRRDGRTAPGLCVALPPAVAAGGGAAVLAGVVGVGTTATVVAVVVTSVCAAAVALVARPWTTRPLSPVR